MKGILAFMKNKKYFISFLIVLLFLLGLYLFVLHKNSRRDLLSALDKNEVLIDYTIDETLAYTLINKNGDSLYGDFFVVFEKKNNTWHRAYESDFTKIMPWKLEVADIDHDDYPEIMIAVKKATPYDKEIKNRMFIFNYLDNILSRKWTGSQIAGIWRDYYTMDLLSSPGHELIFIEQTEEDMEKISVYSWFDFGFFRLADSEAYLRIQKISMVKDNLLEITYIDEDKETNLLLSVVDGKLSPKE